MRSLLPAAASAAVVFFGSCGGPSIYVDADPKADLSSYKTFAFYEHTATDKAAYSTLVSTRLKEATRRELEARGLQHVHAAPQMLVNFHLAVEHRTDVKSVPAPPMGGFYGYRGGVYGVWGGYPHDVETTYDVGTLAIDVVDAAKKQLVWQGIAEGSISREAAENPGPAIDQVVTEVFARYPVPAATAAPAPK